jgi:hypothetical protein
MNQETEEPITQVHAAAPPPIPGDWGAPPAPSGGSPNGELIPTPTSLPPLGRPPAGWLGCGARAAIAVALVSSLLALLVSSLLLVRLARAGSATAAILDRTISELEGVCGSSGDPIIFPFSQTIRFQGDFALPEGLVIPFKGTIPINTVVRLTIKGLPGSPTIEIPIDTAVPVDTRVPIPGGISIPIDTSVPINQQIPVDLCGPGAPAKQLLEGTISDLKKLRSELSFP